MTFINLVGVISFILIVTTSMILRLRTKKKLKDIDGFGGTFKKGNNKGKVVSKG